MTEQERGPSTMSNLDELTRLLEAATPLPWKSSVFDYAEEQWYPNGWIDVKGGDADVAMLERSAEKDAALIVAAVNSLPALIAAARRAEALENEELLADAISEAMNHVPWPGERGSIKFGGMTYRAAAKAIAANLRATLTGEGAPR